MKKLLIFLIAVGTSVSAFADPYRQSFQTRPFVCKTGAAAYEAWGRNNTEAFSAMDMVKRGECRVLPEGSKFRVLEETKEKSIFYFRVEVIGESALEEAQYISGPMTQSQDPEAVLAARKAELAQIPEGCSAPIGGQINRLERGQNGQLFLRRYMVTSKCVNGQMQSFMKPLD
ncbi:hypothetical protein RJO15_07975 [Herbaspirillum huttiense F1]|uniref:hypothetical protein n=1 Tax=Herbaspirillum huttiense TaxID=863372 RepID=UPI002886B4AF|nr:hypothetical protein [Herbaspirillum huttiense]MDT0355698.1 hypothetical protein [Herbaspirillum huttiense F1]